MREPHVRVVWEGRTNVPPTRSIKNYKIFKNTEIKDLTALAVFIGKNGSGKTTFFDIFGFLQDCLQGNVTTALTKRGGFCEVASRGHESEEISFCIKLRSETNEHLITYELSIGLSEKKTVVVKKEVMRLGHGNQEAPLVVLNFRRGQGYAAADSLQFYEDVHLTSMLKLQLVSPDILALKGLGQFKDFPAIANLRRQIEDWSVADFRITSACERQKAKYGEQLSRTEDNISIAVKYIYENHPNLFNKITQKMKNYIPDIEKVEVHETDDGNLNLCFYNQKFKKPFVAKFVSSSTLKILMYLLRIHDPRRQTLLCLENPENQLYPDLHEELGRVD